MNNKSRAEYHIPQNIAGYQNSIEGESYFGLVLYSSNRPKFREYIQTSFLSKLKKDSIYCFQAFISLADSASYALKNNLGVLLSINAPTTNTLKNIDLTPSIEFVDSSFFVEKQNWVKLEAQFKATGNEKYITIGNFRPDSLTDFILLSNGGSTQDAYKSAYYYIDNLYLGPCDSVPIDTPTGIQESSLLAKIKAYPNPINEQFTLENNTGKKLSFQLYNLLGSKVQVGIQQNNNKSQFSMGHLPKGVYLLNIIGESTERATMKLIKK